MHNIYNFSFKDIQDILTSAGLQRFTAGQIFDWIYKKKVENYDLMTNIAKETRIFLKNEFSVEKPKILKKQESIDKTKKFLLNLEDNSTIETVVVNEGERNTLCVSSQVGCRFRCSFCASGLAGFKRNLTASEIIGQYLSVKDELFFGKISNIVFMGVGEPLDNFNNVVKAIDIFSEPKGINFRKRNIAISTCGLIPQIRKLAELDLGVKLSISLHSTKDNIRSRLMPVNKKYPLKQLIVAVKRFAKVSKYPVSFEYVLVKGVNISKFDAQGLAGLFKGSKAKINLIPYNGSQEEYLAPSLEEIETFKRELKEREVFFTSRKPKGQDIDAACGQLKAVFR